MAETLGSLCDKLTIVKLKQWHAEDKNKQQSLAEQELQLRNEIDEYIAASVTGQISFERLTFAANKIYKQEGNVVAEISGNFGEVFSQLADVNCKLWHEQERVYDFENVSAEQKNVVIKHLAILNLERNKCIDRLNIFFLESIRSNNK